MARRHTPDEDTPGEDPLSLASPWRISLMVLAAGGSRRMGQPKPLLEVGGRSLVVHAALAALASSARPIVFVVGSRAERIMPVLAPWPVLVVKNEHWEAGIGSSIQCGLHAIREAEPACDGVLVTLCDQPGLSTDVLQKLIDGFRGPEHLVAARYRGTLGAPALFGRSFFSELDQLPASSGAQPLLRAHAATATPVDLPELAIDLDTPEDYQRYLERHDRPSSPL